MKTTLILCTALAITPAAQADNLTWLGGTSGNWGSASNWEASTIPGSADTANIQASTGRYNININNDFTVNRVIMARNEVKLDNSANTLSLTGLKTENWASTHIIDCKLHLWGDTGFTLNDNLRITGDISGDAGIGLSKAGSDRLTLQGVGTFTGATTIEVGEILVQNPLALQNSVVTIESDSGNEELNISGQNAATLGGLAGSGLVTSSAVGTIILGKNGANPSFSGTFSTAPNITKVGNGTQTISNSSVSLGTVTPDAGILSLTAAPTLNSITGIVWAGGQLDAGATATCSAALSFESTTAGGDLNIPNAAHTLTLTGSFSGATDNYLEKSGPGTLDMQVSGGYGGTLGLPTGTLITNGTSLASASVLMGGGTQLDVTTDGVTTSVGTLSGSGAVALGSQELLLGGNDADKSSSAVLSGNGKITKSGTGTQTFSGANTWSGLLDINGGTIKLGNATTLQNATIRVLTDGGLDLNGKNATLGGLAGSSALNLGSQNITIGGNNSSRTYWGQISGSGGITKIGSGSWKLDQVNTYTGATNINGGLLRGNGGVSGNLTIASGASLGPGASAGTFTVGGNGTLVGTYVCEIDGAAADRIAVGGNLNLTGSTIDFDLLGGGATEAAYLIASYGSLTGTFGTVLDLPAAYLLDYAYHDGVSSNNIAIIENTPPNAITITQTGTVGEWTVTFDKSVVNFNAFNDIVVAVGTGATASGATISGGGPDYTVQLTGMSGFGQLSLEVSTASDVQDTLGNALESSVTGSPYSVDFVVPTVVINAGTATPTNASTLTFAIAFSENVTGVTANDFTKSFSGSSDALQVSGSDADYTVTANNVSGDGDFTLGFNAANNIADLTGNALGASLVTRTLDVDTVAPTATVVALTSSPTNATEVQFSISFDEVVSNFNTADLVVTHAGAPATPVISGSGSPYTVTISNLDGDGTLSLGFNIGNNVEDDHGNGLGASAASDSIAVNNTVPSATITALTSSPTNASTVSFNVAFDETVTGFDVTDLDVSFPGTYDTPDLSGTTSPYTVTIDNIDGDGDLTLSFDAANNVQDNDGNPLGASAATDSITVNNIAPSATITADTSSPTNASTIAFSIDFSESVTGLIAGDLSVSFSGTHDALQLTGSGASYTATIGNVSGEDDMTLSIAASNSVIDSDGNALGASAATDTVTVDSVQPTSSIIEVNDLSPTNATSVSFDVTFSEEVTAVDAADFTVFFPGTHDPAVVTGSGETRTVTISNIAGNGSLGLGFAGSNDITDLAGNALQASVASDAINIDQQQPGIDNFTATTTSPATGSELVFSISFDEDIIGLDSADFSVDFSGTTDPPALSGTQSPYTVTVSNVAGEGTLTLTLANTGHGIADPAGNALTFDLFENAASIAVDTVDPTVSVGSTTLSPSNTTSLVFSLTFSEAVDNFSLADLQLTFPGTHDTPVLQNTQTDPIIGGIHSTEVLISNIAGDGALALAFAPTTDVTDNVGNALDTTNAGGSVLIDQTPPELLSIVPDTTGPITSDNVGFTLLFSEGIAVFKPSYLLVTHTGTSHASASVGLISPSNDYGVTLTGLAGNGSFTLAVNPSSFFDAAGNQMLTSPTSAAVSHLDPLSYADWATLHGLTPGVNDGLDDDPNGNGLNNRAEFALDRDPLGGNDGKERAEVITTELLPGSFSSHFHYTFPVRLGTQFISDPITGRMSAIVEDLRYTVEASPDLSNFNLWMSQVETALSTGLPTLNPGWKYVTFRLVDNTTILPVGFFRIQIEPGLGIPL